MKRVTLTKMVIYPVFAGWLLLCSGCNGDSGDETSGWFTDQRDQHQYEWVRIGTQTWMAVNLAWLPAVSPPLADSDTVPFYYVFRYMGSDVEKARVWDFYADYGVFYNWPAAMNGSDSSRTVLGVVQGVCPDGWHLPSDGEWDILVNFLGGEYTAGKKMKARKDWNNWEGEPGEGDNSSKFNALAAGGRNSDGAFFHSGTHALYWSSTGYDENSAWYRQLPYYNNGVFRYYGNKRYGFSVRCVKDN